MFHETPKPQVQKTEAVKPAMTQIETKAPASEAKQVAKPAEAKPQVEKPQAVQAASRETLAPVSQANKAELQQVFTKSDD